MNSQISFWNYLFLAFVSEQKQQWAGRDRFLALTMKQAAEQGDLETAEICRDKILQNNPRHLLSQHSSAASALKDSDFQFFVKQLARNCPPERAEQLAQGLEFEAESVLKSTQVEQESLLRKLLSSEV